MDEDTTGQPVMRRAEVVLAGLAVAFAVGLAVVGVASALETNEECSPYGYGGYSCVDYDDAAPSSEPICEFGHAMRSVSSLVGVGSASLDHAGGVVDAVGELDETVGFCI